jgi:hypothetical protein
VALSPRKGSKAGDRNPEECKSSHLLIGLWLFWLVPSHIDSRGLCILTPIMRKEGILHNGNVFLNHIQDFSKFSETDHIFKIKLLK